MSKLETTIDLAIEASSELLRLRLQVALVTKNENFPVKVHYLLDAVNCYRDCLTILPQPINDSIGEPNSWGIPSNDLKNITLAIQNDIELLRSALESLFKAFKSIKKESASAKQQSAIEKAGLCAAQLQVTNLKLCELFCKKISVSDPQGKCFWVLNFGTEKTSVPIAKFTDRYVAYLCRVHQWNPEQPPLSPVVFENIIKNVVSEQLQSIAFKF
jgi:hypothetical protein